MALSSEERRRRLHAAARGKRNGAEAERTERPVRNAYTETERAEKSARNTYTEAERAERPARNAYTEEERRLIEKKKRAARLRAERRRREQRRKSILAGAGIILILIILIFAVRGIFGLLSGKKTEEGADITAQTEVSGGQGESLPEAETVPETDPVTETMEEAERLAAMYDYDGAIELLGTLPGAAADPEISAAIAGYEETKAGLVRQDISKITHVFFHSLIVDPENAFDKSRWGTQSDGYNSVMTTISEFEKMLDEFYEDGFVLVGLHDMAHIETTADGTEVMVEGDIMLPEGKKAMVMSQDDVCYYEYMEGAGFADRIIVGEDGKPTCHYVDEEGNEHVGEYDLVPILDRFVEEHPDFSYKGAKACLAFTGYNGILGYRTDETYDPNSDMYDDEKEPNYNIEEDRETAREVVAALREAGYELASHSWGHRDMGSRSLEDMKKDADRWDKNVNQELLGGTCDIILYPFGADVADWHPYTHDNAKFDYLWDLGFRYFCGVDSNQYWVQVGKDYLRQGRRNLDGYMMWMDLSGQRDKLSDLFDDVGAIFDPARPTPVEQ